jgi:phosphocarrier protein HPr
MSDTAVFEKGLTITNKYGLHARPSTQFVELANSFECEVVLLKDGEEVNGKNIMGLMMLGAEQGTELTLRCFGSADAEDCLAGLSQLVESKFGED